MLRRPFQGKRNTAPSNPGSVSNLSNAERVFDRPGMGQDAKNREAAQ